MRRYRPLLLWTALPLVLLARGVFAETPLSPDSATSTSAATSEEVSAGQTKSAAPQQLSDLTLSNFFSAGWNDEYVKRKRETGTPDYALLRVQTNFLEREFRVNYFRQSNIHSATRANLDDMNALIAWAFNRRLMIEVIGEYQWLEARPGGSNTTGGDSAFAARIQLVDTESSSYCINLRATTPNNGQGQEQTDFSYGLAGFEDLAFWLGLDRVGLYYSLQFDSLAGPSQTGIRRNNVAYDITIAKTLTPPHMPLLGGFTPFVENFAQTDLDGAHAGRTLVTVTPGVRFNLGQFQGIKMGKCNWIVFGAELPISDPKPWDAVYRFSYIKNF